ncbi:MAG TPA: peptidylprolyl isomerase [Firmicutes bacterium]|nr:peptidylprolyl isomerase [Bacillota bacterium]
MKEAKPEAVIEMENGVLIRIRLDPDSAPNTVKNFIALAGEGFYSGLIFHRVIPGFMIQGGCPEGNGIGGPGYAIRGEFSANGHHNSLKHERGVISMARSQSYNSAGSQFFITVAGTPYLDGKYAAFGRVTEGMDKVDRIVNEPADSGDRPLAEQKIRQITVETGGVIWEPPEKI